MEPSPGAHPDFYKTLEVDPGASRLQIREAYLRLKNIYATGNQALYSVMDEQEARATMSRVDQAFRTLEDDYLRRKYDESIGLRTKPEVDQVYDQFDGNEDGQDGQDPFGGKEEEPPEEVAGKSYPPLQKTVPGAADPAVHAEIVKLIEAGPVGDGDLFLKIRELLQVSRAEVQNFTKVSIGYIEAVELNDFKKLPAMVYVKGFLKSYLQYLGVRNGAGLIQDYTEKLSTWQQKNPSRN